MKWSLRLGRFLGIDVFLHFTFLLFIGYIFVVTRGSLEMVAFILSAFTCVVLHEYGHALVARRYGIPTRDITLLPIGGVARLERMPSDPKQELWVALAGPAVNVVIAAVLYGVCYLANIPVKFDGLPEARGHFVVLLLGFNLTMIAFNMLPAFPMDGGRVLRAFLAMKADYAKATRWAATVGKGMAMLFAYFAIFHSASPMLIVIAFFVWMGASDETAAAEQKSLLTGVRVRDAMLVDFKRVSPEETAGTVAQLILQGWQADFPVVYDGQVVGLITRQDVIAGLTSSPSMPVSSIMRQEVPSCVSTENLDHVLERMREQDLPLMPVVESGKLMGLVTPENTVEFILIRRALEKR
ncbi:MAG TPA: site-2 protease family protein [Verrucomicrobiales bacterium]|nr:site-2 protease family protein [Verrucomicrobiales bacterium]